MNTGPRVIPFRVGGPIRDPAYFAGRREVLQHIARAMVNLQNVSLHGERRTGKTSVLLYLAHPASDVRLPETHIPVYFTFQELAEASVVNVWQAMADAVAAQIEQRCPSRQADSKRFLATTAEFLASSKGSALFGTGFGRALAQLGESGLKIHLLLDEFDQTDRNPDLGDSFYDALRSLPTRAGNVSYVIASRTGLAALQPTYDKVSSPFFNIFTTIILTPFCEGEVQRLIFDYFARSGLDLSLAESLCTESAYLYDVTGYHPFFLQTLCYHLCAGLGEPDWPRGRVQQEALGAFRTDAEPHFDYYWRVSSKEEQEFIEKLVAGQSVDWKALGNVAKNLGNRCLIIPAEHDWRLFSSVFARWVQEHQLAAWYEEGMTQLAAGEFEQARRSFEEVYAINTDYQDVHRRLEKAKRQLHLKELCRRGEASFRNQNWQEAIDIFEELRKLDPRDGNVIAKLEETRRQLVLDDLYREGMEHVRRQRWRNASSAFERVVRLDPDYRDAVTKLNITREHLSRGKSVLEILRDPLWQGMGVIFAIIALIIALSPFIKDNLSALVKPASTPKPPELCNGAFENNFECWQHGGDLDQTIECDENGCFAVLGNPDYKCEGGVPVGEAWMKQTLKVPQSISPTLSLRYRLFSYDLDLYDFLQIRINSMPVGQFGNIEWDVSSCNREVWDSGWQSVEFDLSSYSGASVEVSLHNVNGAHKWWNTWTYVDSVEVH